MKNSAGLYLLLSSVISFTSLSAQDGKGFLESRIGFWLNGPVAYKGMNESLAPDSGKTTIQNYKIGFSIAINRPINNNLLLTVEALMTSADVQLQGKDSKYFSIAVNRTTLLAGGEYVYYRRAPLALYARLTLGVNFYGEGNTAEFAYHVTPYGIRVGDALAGFLEYGWGYAGVTRFGMALRIDKKSN